jgi:hypothetical protein
MPKLTPNRDVPGSAYLWASGKCDLCGKVEPLVLDIAVHPEGRDKGEKGCVCACPECSKRVVALILTAYAEWRWELAPVAHDIWCHWMEHLMPYLESLVGLVRVEMDRSTQGLPNTPAWRTEMEGALRKNELAITGWKAKVMAGFVDLHDVERQEYYEQADKMLAALGVEPEPKEVEFQGDDGRVFTSGRVRTEGGHDRVQVWNRDGLAGELIVTQGDGEELLLRLGMERKGARRVEGGATENFARHLRALRRGHEAGCTELTGATGAYIRALEDYVKRSIPDLDKE